MSELWRWVGECAEGHMDSIRLRYDETPEQEGMSYCNLLKRDKEGAWNEEYGMCGTKMRWTRIEVIERQYRGRYVRSSQR